jgi:hypothetical protein
MCLLDIGVEEVVSAIDRRPKVSAVVLSQASGKWFWA